MRRRKSQRNPEPWQEESFDYWQEGRRLDSRERWGQRVSPVRAARRRERYEAAVRQMGAEAMRDLGIQTRRRKLLEKQTRGLEAIDVQAGTCKGLSGPCCRKGARFARCGSAGAREDFCFRKDRPCCRDAKTGRFASCHLPARRAELAQLQRLHAQRAARLEQQRAARLEQQRAARLEQQRAANPPRAVAGARIYPQVVAVIARKRASSRPAHDCPTCGAPNGRDLFIHKFQEKGQSWPDVPIVGLPDGSLMFPQQGSRLWGRR